MHYRVLVGIVGFGMGIHRSVGQTVVRVEAEILLTTLVQRVERIEITGQPQRKPNNTMRAWRKFLTRNCVSIEIGLIYTFP